MSRKVVKHDQLSKSTNMLILSGSLSHILLGVSQNGFFILQRNCVFEEETASKFVL
jgi:hypothetical protein